MAFNNMVRDQYMYSGDRRNSFCVLLDQSVISVLYESIAVYVIINVIL